MKAVYNAVLIGIGKPDIEVVFPDFPGCVSAGRSIAEALANAKEGLEFHIEGTLEDGIDISVSSDDAKLVECLAENKGARVALVEVDIPESKTRRLNICLPEFVIQKIDRHLKQVPSESRSGLLARGALEYLEHHAIH